MVITAHHRLQITPRDLLMLMMVYAYDGCSISHLYRRFWPKSDKPFGPLNSCYRRVHQLVADGWLQARRLPSLSGTGSGHLFLTLGPKGRELVAQHFGLARSDLRRLRDIETPFAATHHSQISDVRLALELACERTGLARLDEWVPERQLRVPPIPRVPDPRPEFPGANPPLIPLISDGEFRLSFPGGLTASYRLEIDMDTIPRKRICARLRGQLAYTKVDERPILWVVPNQQRQRALTDWALEEAANLSLDPTIFLVTTKDRVSEDSIFSAIWHVVGGPTIALTPAPPDYPRIPLNERTSLPPMHEGVPAWMR